jgi:dTDP-glucose 4,6-dehydratase
MVSRVLVTGGAGFIGSNLVDYLLQSDPNRESLQIHVLDSLTYAGNQENLPKSSQVELTVGDVRDKTLVEGIVSNIDQIYHLAAESHVDRSIENSSIFVETNVGGTLNILDAVRKFHKRVVLVSTDEVYGSLSEGFATEDSKLNPSSPYSASKAAADLLALSYHHTFETDVVITRCANNYGPKQYPEKLIPLIISKALAGEKLPIYGDGTNIRDWIHVDDHCHGLMLAMHEGEAGNIYNFGDVEHVRNIDLVKKILSHLDISEDLIEFVPDRLGHDFRYAISSERAKSELNWIPSHNLNNDLAATIDYYLMRIKQQPHFQ